MFQARSDDDLLIEHLTENVMRRGLYGPALILVEVGRPLAPLLGQLLWIAQPAFSMLWPAETIGRVAHFLEEPGAGDYLLARLETIGAKKENGQP